MNYLIVYNIHYIHDEASTPEESLKEIKDNLEQIKRIKDRELLESIYDIAQKYRQFGIGYKALSYNLTIKSDLKGEKLLKFINKKIEAMWLVNKNQHIAIGIENIINLDQI